MSIPVFNCKNADDVMKAVSDYDVSFIQYWFVDILGTLKSFQLTPSELEASFEEGMGFDGSSILGFCRIDESDMVAMPDPTTFQICSWRPAERPVARMFCDVVNPDGSPFAADSRYVLKRVMGMAAEKGYTFYVGPELEFFLFADDQDTQVLDSGGYFDAPPLDLGNNIRRDIIFALGAMGIQVEYSHHEVAPSQHEIDLRYQDGMIMADTAMTYRVVVKETARKHGCYATFMPKPIFGENGSGMHVHQSLFKNGRNVFYDASDEYNLSPEGKSYIAGILKHAPEFVAVTNQWVNSYKRLVPGYEAPVYIAWARRNRSALVRVPMYKPGKEAATRMELRCPDPAANPYLCFAVQLASGLKGIEENYVLPDPVEEDIFAMNDRTLKRNKIKALPGSLYEAATVLRKSAFMKEVLGEHLHTALVENKLAEWDEYRTQVTEYELDKYLPIL
ncbi:glutamine synthetase [Pseudodesulfovibrio sp. F-1]|uniref:Glutamine synthetase n=1 Tax=Pseudodesulfovibrio alkaliphilus TaxID=2661613 RepID=A0A7K1KKM4_9BACT|nr:glutamine synthetase family protein [Pseudodesulfovibrio alkaliphilus]MUM76629.1 glutamine synthetase [Pseudodesulfovibrio alkaliphilus]